jgi:hypothetical protein
LAALEAAAEVEAGAAEAGSSRYSHHHRFETARNWDTCPAAWEDKEAAAVEVSAGRLNWTKNSNRRKNLNSLA